MTEERGTVKIEITDDLRLNVWFLSDDETTMPPRFYQNVKETSEPWQSREEILEYVDARFSALDTDNL